MPAEPPARSRSRRPAPRDDRGAAAVELALVLPLLLLVIFGVIDFGRMLHIQITLTEAAREGARATALGLSATPRITSAANGIPLASTTVTTCPADNLNADAVVRLTHAFEPVTPIDSLMSWVGGDGSTAVTITARGVMPCVG